MAGTEDEIFSAPPAPGESQPEPINYNFDIDFDDPASIQRSTRIGFNWRKIGLVSGGVVAVAFLVCLIIWLVAPNTFRSGPVSTVIHYYEHIDEEEYGEACNLLEPGIVSCTQLEANIKQTISKFGGSEINYGWDFIDMKYQEIKSGDNLVQVKVDGCIRIIDLQTNRYLDLPYSDILTLTWHDHRWFIHG